MSDHKKEKKGVRKIGKWLSNVNRDDVTKIVRAFPNVVEGPPRPHSEWGVEDLRQEGITGLYLERKDG